MLDEMATHGSSAHRLALTGRSVRNGIAAAVGMVAFYAIVVRWASGSTSHLLDQVAADWYFIGLVTAGFGAQVALVSELRRRHRLQAMTAAATGAGAGTSVGGMVACCAHHIADLLPFLGLSGAATFLYDYRLLFVGLGVGVNSVGVAVAVRRLRHGTGAPVSEKETECSATVA